MHQVHFQKSRLKGTFSWPVVLEGVQQKRSALLDQIRFHKNINNLSNISQGFIILHQHHSESFASFWVDTHHTTQEKHVIRGVTDFLGVHDNLLELTGFSKAHDDFVGNVGSEVDGQCKSGVSWFDKV